MEHVTTLSFITVSRLAPRHNMNDIAYSSHSFRSYDQYDTSRHPSSFTYFECTRADGTQTTPSYGWPDGLV